MNAKSIVDRLLGEDHKHPSYYDPNLLLKKIAGRLTGINKEDLTTAEKQITNLLITQGLLAFNENGDLEEVETN